MGIGKYNSYTIVQLYSMSGSNYQISLKPITSLQAFMDGRQARIIKRPNKSDIGSFYSVDDNVIPNICCASRKILQAKCLSLAKCQSS